MLPTTRCSSSSLYDEWYACCRQLQLRRARPTHRHDDRRIQVTIPLSSRGSRDGEKLGRNGKMG